MKAGRLVSLLIGCAAAAVLSGCGAAKQEAEPTESKVESTTEVLDHRDPYTDVTGKRVGISLPSPAIARWNTEGKYLEKRFKERGCTVSISYGDGTAERQTADIQGMLANGCDLLIVAAINENSLAPVLDPAGESSTPVIACGRLIRGSDDVSYYVSSDNYKTGQLEGRFIIESLGLKPDVNSREYHMEFAAGDPGDLLARRIYNGAYDELKPYIDAGSLIIGSGQNVFARAATAGGGAAAAEERMRGILGSSYPKGSTLSAVVCGSDTIAGGVIRAIETDYDGKNKVLITGQGCDAAGAVQVMNEKQSMTVFSPPLHEAEVTADLGLTILAGDQADGNLISECGWDFECVYDTASYDNGSGIVPAYLLTPTAITKNNYKKELLDTGCFSMEENTLVEAGTPVVEEKKK